jgi:aminoglycoside phosphotransferase (APT) family kinase protein
MDDPFEEFRGTAPVEERLRFDVERLAQYLSGRIPAFAALQVRQFKGGQSNPSYRLDTPGRSYVLRRKPFGPLLPSAHAVDREYRVITALNPTGFPAPKTYGLCADETVIGTIFYVMDMVEGRIFWDQTLPDQQPSERRAIHMAALKTLADLHNTDYRAIGLEDFGRQGNYMARQIDRWTKQYKASETKTIPEMDQLIDWLPKSCPVDDQTSIVHGDYRLDNVILHPSAPRILAVLDWELSTLGDPLADFAYHCMSWHIPPGQFRGIAGLDLAQLGIPSEAEYVQAYCRRTGRAGIDPSHWDFYLAYNLFRIAAILQGILKRVVDGTAASIHARDAGMRARPMAELGWQVVQKIDGRKSSGRAA